MRTTAITPIALGPGQGKSIQFGPGEHLLFRATADTSGGRFSLFELTVQPVDGPPGHLHREHDEAYYVLEGTFDFMVGDRRATATPGTFVYVPRGTVHAFRNLGARRGRMLVFATPGGVERYFEEVRADMWRCGGLDPADIAPLLSRREHDVEVVGPPLTDREA